MIRYLRLVSACLFVSVLLAGGAVRAQQVSFTIGSGSALNTEQDEIPITVSSDSALQGFVMAFEWSGDLAVGVDIAPANGAGEALADADLIEQRVGPDYMVLGVVVDADASGPEAIPAGDDIVVATATIRCDCPGFTNDATIAFVDGAHAVAEGGPLLDNIAVVDGNSIGQGDGLTLNNGSLLCEQPGGGGTTFACGGALNPDGSIPAAEGEAGETVSVCFYYLDPTVGGSGGIQGLSMAVTYDCQLTCDDSGVDLGGGELERLTAEFFSLHCDNDPSDGDDCEMVVGMLLDVEAPLDGRTLPATDEYGLLFCVPFTISEDAEPDTCLDVSFVDGVNGAGQVATENLVSVDFFEATPLVESCQVCVVDPNLPFIRGDCNSNEAVNIADAAAQVGLLFLSDDDHFPAPCHDACDADDTGALNVTDVVYLLNYLFVPGNPAPPAPFPTAGEDPTDDDPLGCLGEPAPLP